MPWRRTYPSLLLLPLVLSSAAAQELVWRPIPDFATQWGFAIAWDPVRKTTLAFGGEKSRRQDDETWEYDGRRWLRLRPKNRPPARLAAGLAYDPVSKRMLLFGGRTFYKDLGDTWAWDGKNWTQLRPTTSPSPRSHVAMATDPVRGRILLFGGAVTSTGYVVGLHGDTWEWDGSNWIRSMPKTSPSARSHASLVWHRPTRSLHMFGGSAGFFLMGKEHWRWTGSNWQRLADTPLVGASAALPEPKSPSLLIKGSSGGNHVIDWWRWDGKLWTKTALGMKDFLDDYAFDEARQRIIKARGGGLLSDCRLATWEYDGTKWAITSIRGYVGGTHPRYVYEAHKDRVIGFGCVTQSGSGNVYELRDGEYRLLSTHATGHTYGGTPSSCGI